MFFLAEKLSAVSSQPSAKNITLSGISYEKRVEVETRN